MKILISADRFFPAQTGGPSNSIYWHAKALTQAGHDVTVIATSQDLPDDVTLNHWLMMDCGRVIYTKNIRFYLPITHIFRGWKAIQKADVMHVNSLFYPASFVWICMSRLAGKPVVWSPHGELSPAALRYRPRLKRLLINVFRFLSSSVWFHATCAAEVNQIRQHFGENTLICDIPNRMELPKSAVRFAQPYLLFMGRLHPIKALDRLLLALSTSTLFQQSDYSLLIAGPDSSESYTKYLTDMAHAPGLSNKVYFLGVVQGAHKEHLYANARLLILPSHSENFGNVVIESLAQGTPVIASTHTPWQVLETKQAGRWVSNDPDALREAIEPFLTMPDDQYAPYRERALCLAQRDYDLSANTTVWDDFYTTASGHSAKQTAFISTTR